LRFINEPAFKKVQDVTKKLKDFVHCQKMQANISQEVNMHLGVSKIEVREQKRNNLMSRMSSAMSQVVARERGNSMSLRKELFGGGNTGNSK
jgi:hypothetical protein